MTMPRGLCQHCLGEYDLRYDGMVRVHGGYSNRWTAERRVKTCPGSGEPPLKLEARRPC